MTESNTATNSVSNTAAAITVTEAAQSFLRRMLRFSGLGQGAGMRLVVSPGGCSGYQSEFAAQAVPASGEQVLELGALRVFVPAASAALLAGVTVDFLDTPMQTGLVFHNPAGSACACGSSTGVAAPAVARVDIAALRRAPPKVIHGT